MTSRIMNFNIQITMMSQSNEVLFKSIQMTGNTNKQKHILIYRDAPYYVWGV